MGAAAIAVRAIDARGSAAALYGHFDQRNCWFLERHLAELDGDVVLDCSQVDELDEASLACLRQFVEGANLGDRRVVLQALAAKYWPIYHAAA